MPATRVAQHGCQHALSCSCPKQQLPKYLPWDPHTHSTCSPPGPTRLCQIFCCLCRACDATRSKSCSLPEQQAGPDGTHGPLAENDGAWETAWILCRCHPKMGLNTLERGEQPSNGAGVAAADRRWGWWHTEGGSEKGAESPGSILHHTEGPQEGAAAPEQSRLLCFTRQSALEQEGEGGGETLLQLPRSCHTCSRQEGHGSSAPPSKRKQEPCLPHLVSIPAFFQQEQLARVAQGQPGQSCALFV